MAWINPWSSNVENSNRKYSYSNIHTKEQIDILLNQGDWKSSIQTFDDIATSYPVAIEGWIVPVDSSQIIYYYNGIKWDALFGDSDSMKLVVPSTKILRTVNKEKFDELTTEAPTSLDTFKEVADALGNDSNFSSTILFELNNKISSDEKNVPNGVAILTPEGSIIDANGNLMVTDPTKYKQVSGVIQSGEFSNAEGFQTSATGENSHAEGYKTIASGTNPDAKILVTVPASFFGSGLTNNSVSYASVPQLLKVGDFIRIKVSGKDNKYGYVNTIVGTTATFTTNIFEGLVGTSTVFEMASVKFGNSHAEGMETIASGAGSHAEGSKTIASGAYSHAEGMETIASGNFSHAEGYNTLAIYGVTYKISSVDNVDKTITLANTSGLNIEDLLTIRTTYGKTYEDISIATITNNIVKLNITNDLTSSDYAIVKKPVAPNYYSSHAEGHASSAIGQASHAEGYGTIAVGIASHAEGASSKSEGQYSHAEGYTTLSSGNNSHAEGSNTVTSGNNSHAEGSYTVTSGNNSHAEGSYTRASGDSSHAEGYNTKASGNNSHAEGSETSSIGVSSHAEGFGNISIINYSHSEGLNNTTGYGAKISTIDIASKTITVTSDTDLTKFIVGDTVSLLYFETSSNPKTFNSIINSITDKSIVLSGFPTEITVGTTVTRGLLVNTKQIPPSTSIWGAHVEGVASYSYGLASHAEGLKNIATANGAHAEGYNTAATKNYAHSEGNSTVASGISSHAEGDNTTASGTASHAQGATTIASGNYSHSSGYSTTASVFASTVMGQNNLDLTGNATSFSITNDAFVIGNGSSITSKSNAFRVSFNGSVYALSAFNSTGADYAEYFEWEDKNVNNEDRVGYFVTLEGDKIKIANSSDEYILGVVSVNPSVIGDSYQDDWNGKYLTDDWGRIQYEWIDIPEIIDNIEVLIQEAQYDEEENKISPSVYEEQKIVIQEARKDYVPVINPNWNSSVEYIPREKRKEWSPVGIIGKLLVRDDGTCNINGYCKPNNDGIATSSLNGYRVIERISDNIVKVFLK